MAAAAHPGGRADGGQLARQRRPDLRRERALAPGARNSPQDLERLPFTLGSNADGSPRIVRLNQVATVREGTGPNQINRRDLTREVAINANVSGRSAGEVSATSARRWTA
jgi:Cu/Ag efflux pump CusA